jgi:hypothetical protein
MRRHLLAAAALAAALAGSTAARAATTVVTFGEFNHSSSYRLYGDVTSQGFSFTSNYAQNGMTVWGNANPFNADPGFATLSAMIGVVTVRRTDGELFSLSSLHLADFYDEGAASEVLFTFFDGAETTTETIRLDQAKGLQAFALNRGRLQWFSLTPTGAGMQIDNLNFGSPIASAVPEPATWAMMILGLGGVGAVLRTRRREGLASV